MPTYGGKDSRGKIIKVKPYDLEGDDRLLWLTERQRGLLLAMTEYLDWRSRWETLPSPLDDDDYRDSYVSELKNRLMVMLEFCAEVINCLENDEDTRNALTNIINNILGNGTQNVPGEELSEEELNRNMAGNSNPSCNYVILGRQCSAIVRFFNDGNEQFFDKVLVADNVIRLAQQIAALPFFNLVTKQVGVDSALEFIGYLTEAFVEQYNAGVDDTYLDNLAKKLFCLCRLDCKVTLSRFFQMTAENINEIIPKSITEGLYRLVDVLEIFLGLDTVGTDTADLVFWLDGTLAKVASVITFKTADRALDFMLNSAANDASFDLDISELECPEPEFAVPTINLTPCFADEYGGTLITDLGGGMWEITSTLSVPSGFDYRVTIKDVDDRTFYLSDVSFPDGGFSGCITGNFESGGCFINGCDNSTFRYGENVTNYVWTFYSTARVRFRMSLP